MFPCFKNTSKRRHQTLFSTINSTDIERAKRSNSAYFPYIFGVWILKARFIGFQAKCTQDATISVYLNWRLNGKLMIPGRAMKNRLLHLLSTIPLIPDDFPPEKLYWSASIRPLHLPSFFRASLRKICFWNLATDLCRFLRPPNISEFCRLLSQLLTISRIISQYISGDWRGMNMMIVLRPPSAYLNK